MRTPSRNYNFMGPRVTLIEAHGLIDQVNSCPAAGAQFNVDMSEVQYLDSLCLSVLMLVRHRIARQNGVLNLTGLSPSLESALRLMSMGVLADSST